MAEEQTDLFENDVAVLDGIPPYTNHEEFMTAQYKALLGDCDHACAYHEKMGWCPEDGCPTHDVEVESS